MLHQSDLMVSWLWSPLLIDDPAWVDRRDITKNFLNAECEGPIGFWSAGTNVYLESRREKQNLYTSVKLKVICTHS